jgi:glycogen phosphorylase
MTVVEAQTEDSLLSASPTGSKVRSRLIAQYGCGSVQLTGTADALYERHLVFDNVMEAMRDILSQRWIQTEKTYQRADPKRAYYLSMEFLIGRSLANNVPWSAAA